MAKRRLDLTNLPKACNDIFYPLLFNHTKRFEVLMGGAGSGKSEFAGMEVLCRCMTEPGHRYLVVRKVASTISGSTFQLLKDIIERHGWWPMWFENKSTYTLTCSNGSVILHTGLDDPEKVKSKAGITSIWIEEATELTENDLDQLNLRLRGICKYFKKITLTFNPISVTHWLKKRFFDYEDPDAVVIVSTYRDNKFIDDVYKNEIEKLKNKNGSYYSIYGKGEWGRLDGVIFEPLDLMSVWPDEFEDTFYGLDFGFNNPTALVKIQVHEYNAEPIHVYLTEMIYGSGIKTPSLISRMNDLNIDEYDPIFGDPADPGRIGEIYDGGFNAKPADKGQGSVEAGISHMQGLRLHSKPSNTKLNKEFDTYSWEVDKEGNPLDKPVKFGDHSVDAVRYGIYTRMVKKQKYEGTALTPSHDVYPV